MCDVNSTFSKSCRQTLSYQQKFEVQLFILLLLVRPGARSAGNLSEQEGGQMYLPEQKNHELADSSGSQPLIKHIKITIMIIKCEKNEQ